jgi:hypothetical protein
MNGVCLRAASATLLLGAVIGSTVYGSLTEEQVLEISAAKPSPTGAPRIQIRVSNGTDAPVLVLPFLRPEGARKESGPVVSELRFEILGPDGKRARYLVPSARFALEDTAPITSRDYVRLPPGMFIGKTVELTDAFEYEISKPGRYLVRAVFESTAGRHYETEMGTKHTGVLLFDGTIRSNDFVLEFVP